MPNFCPPLHIKGHTLRPPFGYDGQNPPELSNEGSNEEGEGCCPHCFFSPCIVAKPPSFLQGSSAPYPRNRQHRFRLYRGFWRALKDLGLWQNPRYLERKREKTTVHDVREVIPSCIVKVKWNIPNEIITKAKI